MSTELAVNPGIRRAARLARAPVCVGVHAIFAGDAREALEAAGVARIATCNTIAHPTNAIDLNGLIAAAVQDYVVGRTLSTAGSE